MGMIAFAQCVVWGLAGGLAFVMVYPTPAVAKFKYAPVIVLGGFISLVMVLILKSEDKKNDTE